MRASLLRLAEPATAPLKLRPGASSRARPVVDILPPIPLYRALLRLHRRALTPEERVFGDTYVKAEFRRHRSIDNPLHIVGFLTEWTRYGQMVAERAAARQNNGEGGGWSNNGHDDWSMERLVERMSDQQIGQVHELWEAIRRRARDSVDDEDLVRQAQLESDDPNKGKA